GGGARGGGGGAGAVGAPRRSHRHAGEVARRGAIDPEAARAERREVDRRPGEWPEDDVSGARARASVVAGAGGANYHVRVPVAVDISGGSHRDSGPVAGSHAQDTGVGPAERVHHGRWRGGEAGTDGPAGPL